MDKEQMAGKAVLETLIAAEFGSRERLKRWNFDVTTTRGMVRVVCQNYSGSIRIEAEVPLVFESLEDGVKVCTTIISMVSFGQRTKLDIHGEVYFPLPKKPAQKQTIPFSGLRRSAA